jgi:hypothetical protein
MALFRLSYCMLCLLIVANVSAQNEPGVRYVSAGLVLIDLYSVDNVKGTIGVEFTVSMKWTDESIVKPGQQDEIRLQPDSVLLPDIQFRHLLDLRLAGKPKITLQPNGRITYRQRIFATLKQRFDLYEFPFDSQLVDISLFTIDPGVRLLQDEEFTGIFKPDDMSITNWQINYTGEEVTDQTEYGIKIHSLSFNYLIQRNSRFYLYKVIIPLVLVVLMSWSVFWINPRNISAQLTVSVTAILTLIVFQYSVAQSLPELPYLTKLDEFILWTDILVFMAFVETIVTSYFEDRGKTGLSLSIDNISRWTFPLVFLVVLLLSLVF